MCDNARTELSLLDKGSVPRLPSPRLRDTLCLPPELMAEIFAMVCLTHIDREKTPIPFMIGRVCGEWREIIWSTPVVWSYLSIRLSATRYDAQYELLEAWLTRSGEVPLTICASMESPFAWGCQVPKMFIRLLSKTAYRWREIEIALPHWCYPFLGDGKQSLPLLHSVISHQITGPKKRERLNFFQFAPCLRTLHLDAHYLTDVDIQWDQLTAFTLERFTRQECFDVLAETSNLVHCHVKHIVKSVAPSPCLVRLPALHKLVVADARWDYILWLLAALVIPSLHTLELSPPLVHSIIELKELSPAISRLGCHLRALKLTITYQFHCLLHVLRDIRTLEELSLEVTRDHRDPSLINDVIVLDLLQLYSTEAKTDSSNPTILTMEETFGANKVDCYFPKLKAFEYSGRVLPNDERFASSLTDVIECRRDMSLPSLGENNIALLESVEVGTKSSYDFELEPDIRERLEMLITNGLKLSIDTSWL